METDVKPLDIQTKPTKEELLYELDLFIENIESLPSSAMLTPVTHYDLAAALLLLSSILKMQNNQ